MTARRTPGAFAAAWTAIRALGEAWVADQLGASASRLRQLANPNRDDSAVLDLAVRADALARAQGLGTPILDTYRRRLAALEQPSRRTAPAVDHLRIAATAIADALSVLGAASQPGRA